MEPQLTYVVDAAGKHTSEPLQSWEAADQYAQTLMGEADSSDIRITTISTRTVPYNKVAERGVLTPQQEMYIHGGIRRLEALAQASRDLEYISGSIRHVLRDNKDLANQIFEKIVEEGYGPTSQFEAQSHVEDITGVWPKQGTE